MEDTIKELLTRSVVDCIQKDELEKALSGGSKLRVYLGIDPSRPDIHLGHTIGLRKLAQFQALGHKAILLIGDFTATIGDPSGRDKMREPLTREQVLENAKDYLEQANKVLPLKKSDNPVEVRYNSEWHGQESKADLISHAYLITVGQLIERDMFQERMKNNQPISLAEFLYPYLQGYDAVKLEADVQIGGTDQTFNMLMGRDLRKKMANKNHIVMTTPLIPGTDGRKMSKTYNNTINISDSPSEIYGKTMSINDDLILPYFEYLTDVPMPKFDQIREELKTINPRIIKSRLAKQIVASLFSQAEADQAEADFNRVFSDKKNPEDMAEFTLTNKKSIIDLLLETKLAASKSEGYRLIDQGGVSFDSARVSDPSALIDSSGVLQIGKRRFVKINRR